MATAVIMAGGRSERMRASLGPEHKSLVRVLGVPMLERNVLKLLSLGFRDMVVVTSVHDPEIATYVHTRCHALVRAMGATIECFQELQPLGTIGAAGELCNRSDTLLVVNVDNLTTLDFQALIDRHHQSQAALTLATHQESFQMPFGEVIIRNGYITRYREKPTQQFSVSSGISVLSRKACDVIPRGCRTDLPELVAILLGHGESVAAFEHNAAWIDVNEAAAVDKAEQLISAHFQAFEYWHQVPDREVAALLLESPPEILLERWSAAAAYTQLWHLPVESLRQDDHLPGQAIARMLQAHPGWPRLHPEFLTAFDDLDAITGRLVRHHVFFARADKPLPLSCRQRERQWIALDETRSGLLDTTVARALAALRRRR